MKVTNTEIIPIRAQKGLIAFAEVTLDNCLFVSSIAVHSKLDGRGYRITYPTKKVGSTEKALFHPIERSLSKEIESAVATKAKEIFE